MRKFKNDRDFLLRYYALSTIVTLLALAATGTYFPKDYPPSVGLWIAALLPLIFTSFVGIMISNAVTLGLCFAYFSGSLTLWHFLLIPLGTYLGMLNVPVIHNCAHGNFRPRWLNRALGELCSLHLLSGFPGFTILHLLHHQHPDDPVLDPHPNLNLTYWQFLNGLKKSLRTAFHALYVEHWGDDGDARLRWKAVRILLSANRVLRALLILFLLGPIGFAFFFIPSILANQLTYAHINYYTHERRLDGSVVIVDLNHTWAYRLLNRILLGIYFHGAHHRNCSHFNPATAS